MPPILIPTAGRPDTYIQPSEVGINALEAAASTAQHNANTQRALYDETGRNAQRLFAGLAEDLNKREAKQSEQEISKAGNALTEIQLQQIKEHGDTGSYPSADDKLQAYRNQLIDKGATDKTLKWFDQESNRIRLHTATVQASERVKNAGQNAVTDLSQFVNGQAAIAYHDPSALDHALGTIDSTVQNGFGGMQAGHKAEAVQKAKGAIIEQAVQGYVAQGNFDAAQKLIGDSKYAPFIGEKLAVLNHHVDQQQKAQGAQARADQTFQESQDKKDASAALANLTAQTIHLGPDGKPDGTITVPNNYYSQLVNLTRMPGADHGMIDAAIKDAQAIEKRTRDGVIATTDPLTYKQFSDKMFKGLTDQELFVAHAAGKLSDHDFTMFKGAVTSAAQGDPVAKSQKHDFDQFVKSYEDFVLKSSMIYGKNALGQQRYGELQRDKWEQFQAGLAAGKTPKDMFSPGSPDFLMKDIKNYQIDAETAKKGFYDSFKGPLEPLPPVKHDLPPLNPGESYPEWKKRTGR